MISPGCLVSIGTNDKESTMGGAFIIRYTTRADAAQENQGLVEKVFAQLAAEDPGGLRYATFRLADGVTFMHLVIREGVDPLSGMAAFADFQRGIAERCVEGPVRTEMSLVGAYRLLTG
jgi:hypothetical protein